jgi:hypothetical protein
LDEEKTIMDKRKSFHDWNQKLWREMKIEEKLEVINPLYDVIRSQKHRRRKNIGDNDIAREVLKIFSSLDPERLRIGHMKRYFELVDGLSE